VKRTKPAPKLPNYVRKLRDLWRSGAIPRDAGLHMLTVWHDGWCGIYKAQRCNCDPAIQLRATVPGNLN
jgi:hypothetical protein